VAAALDALKDAGFHWATRAGVTIAIEDVVAPPNKAQILESYERRADKVQRELRPGPDHRRGASSGAHRDLDARDRRGGAGHGGGPSPDTNSVWMMGQLRRPR